MRAIALSFLVSALASAQSSPEVLELLRSVATTLSDAHSAGPHNEPDARPFFENFDSAMPGFATFRDEIEALVNTDPVGTQIEVLSDEGDDHVRHLQLDWILEIDDRQPRRKIVKCTIERRKGHWKITALDPIDFFKG
jgi:hypothetical protein